MSALLCAAGLAVDYPTGRGRLRALEGVSVAIEAGEALGIVGESGSGKSTLVRALLGLVAAAEGSVAWQGRDLSAYSRDGLRAIRRDLTVVFQDPFASLDPRRTVGQSVAEPLDVHEPALSGAARRDALAAMLARVGLDAGYAGRYPHQLSGGQCQRVAIARAMITRPRLLVCDEPLSALDVSVQAQIINLLLDLRRDTGMALVFVSHNLAVVQRLCTRLLVLYLGRTVEAGTCAAVYAAPRHPYTRLLLDSVPTLGGARRVPAAAAELEPASRYAPPSGCAFRNRCRHAEARCAAAVPALESLGPDRAVACLRAREQLTGPGASG